MDGEPVKVHHQNEHGQGHTASPENVADDDGPKSVLIIFQYRRDDSARGCGDDGGNNRQKPDRSHVREGLVVFVHTVKVSKEEALV